jgi:apolipoprotein N-acyltransferase
LAQNQILKAVNLQKTPAEALDWQKSLPWLALAVACFHAAYTSIKYPAAGLLIFGYAFGLVKLTDQPNVRRAFYFGLVTGFLCYAPQLWFFTRIFNVAAALLWLVLAFWIGLFTAIACGCIRRWGKAKAVWLVPVIWTGVEFFRSELYPLKFSWLNISYAFPNLSLAPIGKLGMYGVGFVLLLAAALLSCRPAIKKRHFYLGLLFLALLIPLSWAIHLKHQARLVTYESKRFPVSLAGIQLEFPSPKILPKVLGQALAKHADTQIFVLSEYALDGPPTDALKDWCRENQRYLVVGGKEPLGTTNYFNTAYIIGTNGNVVFQQVKCVPIQFFQDGLPTTNQAVWQSPWGKIGICICYDLSYTRVTDELIRQGAQLLIVPTMDIEEWGRHQHELHSRVALVRAAEYGVPIFRLASSGISQSILISGHVNAQTPFPGMGEILATHLQLPTNGSLPLDRYLAPLCTGVTAMVTGWLLFQAWRQHRQKLLGKAA